MPNVVELNDSVGFENLKQSVQEEAKDDRRRGDAGFANRNLHRLEMVRNPHGEPDQGRDRAVIMQKDQGYRPGSNRGSLGDVKFYNEEQLPLMEEHIFEDRLGHTSTPYVDKAGLRPEHRRPEANVDAGNDIWSIDPAIEEDLGVDVDLLANDMAQSHNAPKMDLDNASQDGIDDVKERKEGLITERQELQKEAAKILQKLGNMYQPTGQPALQTMQPVELADFVEDEIEYYLSDQKVNQTRVDQLLSESASLRRFAEQIVGIRDETEVVGRETFRSTLRQPGFDRPSGVNAEDAVEDYGIGSADYLRIS